MNLKSEAYRKLIHFSSSIIPLFYAFTFKDLTLKILIPSAILFIMLDIMRLSIDSVNKIYMSVLKDIVRIKEGKRFTSATNLLISSVIAILIFEKSIAVACLLFLTVSDSAAALVGKRFGKVKILNKTLEGSLAFLFSSLLIVYFVKSLNLVTGIFGAFSATFIELVVLNIDDNLSIPLISGLIMQLINSFLL